MRAVKENAYAKINLFLDTTAKRADGYHDVRTVMHSVSLFDTLTVSVAAARVSSVSLRVVGNDRLVSDDKNLAVKAARLYLERASLSAEVKIKLEKRIPVAAGLAGGSSDAAATLRAMNKLFGRYFSERALLGIALELGSDVPYCLIGGTALCEGRGEIITPLPKIKLCTVPALSDEYVSTPVAYAALDRIYNSFDGSVKRSGEELFPRVINSVKRAALDSSAVYNIFEDAARDICPKSIRLKTRMYSLGASAACMSGSGPSVFGVFDSLDSARRAADILTFEGYTAFAAESV